MNASIMKDLRISALLVLKAKIPLISFWLLLAMIALVLMAVQFSARQPATIALDIGLSIIHLVLPLFIVLQIYELFVREFERKLYLTTLTYPRARTSWLVSRVVTITFFGLSLLLLLGLTLAGLTIFVGSSYEQTTPVSLGYPYVLTLGFIVIDMLVVIAIATLLAVTATTPSFVFVGAVGFTIIARSYTPIIELLRSKPYVVAEFSDPSLYQDSLGMIAFLLPDLGRLDIRMIALYDKMAFLPEDWILLIVSCITYALALFGLSIWLLNRREFN